MGHKFKFFLSALLVLLFGTLSTTCFATTGTDLINQYLNTYGSTRVDFAEAGFKYYYEGYNGTTGWRQWLFCVNEPTVSNSKITQIRGPFYSLAYSNNKGFADNNRYLNSTNTIDASGLNNSILNNGDGGYAAFNSSYYPNVVNSNISAYNRPLQYYEDLLNPTWNGVFEDGSQRGVINFNENGYYIYTNPLYPGIDYSKFRLVLNLVELSANGVSQMTKESMSASYADNIVKLQDILTQSLENQQIISLESIKKYLKTSKIYRLEYSIIAYDQNNNISTSAFCTSEFFSLNSWTSDKILVRNISEFFGDSSGGIISPSGEISSGDYIINNTINNIGADMNQNFNELNNSVNNLNNFFSGDINSNNSGDLNNALKVEIDVEDPTADFFTWFFEQLKECFTVNGNQQLSFSILDNNFTINSDDYILDIPILKTVIGFGSGVFILYGIFKDIRREIEKIKEGKFEEIASEDITANMM